MRLFLVNINGKRDEQFSNNYFVNVAASKDEAIGQATTAYLKQPSALPIAAAFAIDLSDQARTFAAAYPVPVATEDPKPEDTHFCTKCGWSGYFPFGDRFQPHHRPSDGKECGYMAGRIK